MIGWIIGIVYSIACITLFIYSVIEFNEGGEEEAIMGIVLSVIGLGLYVAIFSSSCYTAKISIPEEYKTINNKIDNVQKIITNTTLNLADTSMNTKLADLIIEKENILLKVRINNQSPFALFKINLDEENFLLDGLIKKM